MNHSCVFCCQADAKCQQASLSCTLWTERAIHRFWQIACPIWQKRHQLDLFASCCPKILQLHVSILKAMLCYMCKKQCCSCSLTNKSQIQFAFSVHTVPTVFMNSTRLDKGMIDRPEFWSGSSSAGTSSGGNIGSHVQILWFGKRMNMLCTVCGHTTNNTNTWIWVHSYADLNQEQVQMV